MVIKTKNWTCNKDTSNKGDMVFCVSKEGKLLSVFDDGTIRFSTHKGSVKIDGKELKDVIGVELE